MKQFEEKLLTEQGRHRCVASPLEIPSERRGRSSAGNAFHGLEISNFDNGDKHKSPGKIEEVMLLGHLHLHFW
jgi:hypothetical protein